MEKIYPGRPFPLGATWDGGGVNFAIYSENATSVELCFFEADSKGESHRYKMNERSNHVWHCYVPLCQPGQHYGYRIDGAYDPANGHRFNPHKLLLDPYAKAISGTLHWHPSLFGYKMGDEAADLSYDETDSAPFVPKAVVIDPNFNWDGDKPPQIPYHRTIIYEAHVKGFTQQHPEIPEEIRGTYSAIAHPVTIQYLKDLGITAIELLPVHYFITDGQLESNGLTNYWGYNTICFFAPDVRYSSKGGVHEQVFEFKNMVKQLHKAGIEVILDVVYNHTAEGNQLGPTISFRGIDNSSYYRLAEDRRYYMDYTGCGNTLNTYLPSVLRLIMDSLRYWITEMHVDGFRFDLASALARELHEVNQLSAFFDIIHQDPVISQVKLIAEPWDVGEGGYQVGKFPPGWAEWNGKYRDCMRDFWRGADSMLSEFAERFTGSSDLYKNDYRRPTASINFITAHDGFTLRDLVSYNEKHNEANGENNNDGESHNRSWNCGAEGETDNEDINRLRKQQVRNFLTTLFLSQGVPMLVSGDELGKTQAGNNNAYCQDNPLSWIDWAAADGELLNFTKNLIHLYKSHPVFSRRRWFKGAPVKGVGLEDIAWFLPGGLEMSEENWNHDFAKSLGIYLNGQALRTVNEVGEPEIDDSFYMLFNAHHESVPYTLPSERYGSRWKQLIDTAEGDVSSLELWHQPKQVIEVKGRSVILLIQPLHS
ncbi:MAG: glycogen debranching protein [Flaviaesturariibacter sp.]|nr:glycogen debranching protein [Flaviaesturariibacter sp.]